LQNKNENVKNNKKRIKRVEHRNLKGGIMKKSILLVLSFVLVQNAWGKGNPTETLFELLDRGLIQKL
jgi:hypothetical protein